MKIISLALAVALAAVCLASWSQVPFLNSTGLTVNEIPYKTRLHFMAKANEALYKYSGPWSV
jgi:hypothetical protein